MPQHERRETRERITGGLYLTVARHIGYEIVRGRSRAIYRNGKNPNSMSHDIERGRFTDFKTDQRGDMADLVRLTLRLTEAETFRWLEGNGYRTPLRRLSAAEAAEQRQRREAEDRRRIDVADFRRGLYAELDCLKVQALDSGDDEALEAAASLQFRLSQQPEDVMSQMLSSDGARVRSLIELAREDRGNAAQITARIVGMLAGAELERERAEALHCAA
jgi:hypothetical protein